MQCLNILQLYDPPPTFNLITINILYQVSTIFLEIMRTTARAKASFFLNYQLYCLPSLCLQTFVSLFANTLHRKLAICYVISQLPSSKFCDEPIKVKNSIPNTWFGTSIACFQTRLLESYKTCPHVQFDLCENFQYYS